MPSCSDESGQQFTKLWDGYSLLYVEGNEKAHNQDLGEKTKNYLYNYFSELEWTNQKTSSIMVQILWLVDFS